MQSLQKKPLFANFMICANCIHTADLHCTESGCISGCNCQRFIREIPGATYKGNGIFMLDIKTNTYKELYTLSYPEKDLYMEGANGKRVYVTAKAPPIWPTGFKFVEEGKKCPKLDVVEKIVTTLRKITSWVDACLASAMASWKWRKGRRQ